MGLYTVMSGFKNVRGQLFFKDNSIDQLEIVPVYVLFFLFFVILFFIFSLLLFCWMILVNLLAFLQYFARIFSILDKLIHILCCQSQNIRICLRQSVEINIILRWSLEKLKLRIIFLSFRECNKEVFAISSGVLSCVLNKSNLIWSYFFWNLCCIPISIWLL